MLANLCIKLSIIVFFLLLPSFLQAQTTTYYSRQSGDWDDPDSWTTNSDGSGGPLGAGIWPGRTANVVILPGHTITIDAPTDNNAGGGTAPDDLGRSNVGPFAFSNVEMFYHTGDILVRGILSVTGEMMIEGYTFLSPSGALNTTSSLVNLGYLEAAASSGLSSLNSLILTGNSTSIINTNSILTDDLIISHTDAVLCGTGVTALQNGAGSQITYANLATVAQICTTFQVTCPGGGCTGGPFPVTGTGIFLLGNTGPAGVGNQDNNQLWLKADDLSLNDNDKVTSWPDASGNGLTAVANSNPSLDPANQPAFQANAVNSVLPSVSFDGGDWLTLGTPASLDLIPQTHSMSFFGAFNVNTGNTGTFLSKAINTPGDVRQYQFQTDGPNRFTTFVGNDYNLGTLNATGGWTLGTAVITTSATGYNSWVNEQPDLTNNGVGTSTTTVDVLVGARRVDATSTATSGFRVTGNIAELILYSAAVNTAQRILINNYLSSKYNITLNTNNVYTMDNTANGDFDFETAGIGQASDGSNHRDAKGTGIVRMWNPNDLANGEFLMWGHDNTILYSSTTTGVDGTTIEERLSRTWRVSESGNVGNVSVSFDISSLGTPLGSNLRLLIDRDGDGFADNDVTPVAGAFADNTIVFSGINFQDGDRFTLGNTDASNPLPIELTGFRAKAENHVVRLSWSTASERNNDFFTVERSKDAKAWEAVQNIKGAGTSQVANHYETVDDGPYSGASYYRLKQTDYDRRFKYFNVVRVVVEHEIPILPYPNPFSESFKLTGEFNMDKSKVRLFNSSGMELPVNIKKAVGQIIITPGNIPHGLYILQVADGFMIKTIKVIKR